MHVLDGKKIPYESHPYDRIFVSAGKVGLQIELTSVDLIAVVGCMVADIV